MYKTKHQKTYSQIGFLKIMTQAVNLKTIMSEEY